MADDQGTIRSTADMVFYDDLFGGVADPVGTPREIQGGVVRDGDQPTDGQRQNVIDITTTAGKRERHLTVRDVDWSDRDRRAADRILNRSDVRRQRSTWRAVADMDVADAGIPSVDRQTIGNILIRLNTAVSPRERAILICTLETQSFTGTDRDRVLPVLWQYIRDRRESEDAEEQAAVGSAIRKYIANMDVSQMGHVAELFDAGQRGTLSSTVELTLAKMVYRKYAANPPAQPDPQPAIAERLFGLVTGYMNPVVLPKEKFAAVASLAVAALVAMRSSRAEMVLAEVSRSPFTWFRRAVVNDLDRLAAKWRSRDPAAAQWSIDLKLRCFAT